MRGAGIPAERYRFELDTPTPISKRCSSVPGGDDYQRRLHAVGREDRRRCEVSARSQHVTTSVKPYAADDLPNTDLAVGGITTVEAQRTFWDKVVILHGLRRWYDHRGELRHGGQRVSRHYYDVFRLLQSRTGEAAEADRQLGEDCVRHARMFFNTADFDLDEAAPGTLSLTPSSSMQDALERDYTAMAGMIMGPAPAFGDVMAIIAALEQRLNEAG